MKKLWFVFSLAMLAMITGPAHACIIDDPFDIEDVRQADIVVVGRLANYRVVDRIAHFEIEVDEVLAGQSPQRLRVHWGSTARFSPAPVMPQGQFLVALHRLDLTKVLDRGWGRRGLASGDLMVLQEGCSPRAFFFNSVGENAATVRRILLGR